MGLYNALSKHYNLEEFDIGYANNKKDLSAMLQMYLDKFKRKLFHIQDCGYGRIKYFNRIARKKYAGKDEICFQFEECPCCDDVKSFIYQDLHVGFYKRVIEDMPELSQVVCPNLKVNEVEKRANYQRMFYDNAEKIFTMSHWLIDEMVNNYGLPREKLIYAGGGYNVDPYLIEDNRKQGNKMLFVGRDFERKNGPLVVDAYQVAKKEFPELELYIAGPKDLNVDIAGVKLLGDLSYEELVEYFNICDIFVMPSKFEAYGLVFAEALAFGLPCIGRNAFEMPYFIENGKTGFLLEKESPEALADLMLKLIRSEEIKNNVKVKREWYLREYSWDAVAQRIANVMDGYFLNR